MYLNFRAAAIPLAYLPGKKTHIENIWSIRLKGVRERRFEEETSERMR